MQINLTSRLTMLILAGSLLILFAAWGGVEYYTAQSSFCGGSCHTMTEQYDTWKSNTHHADNNPDGMQADCVTCHFLPGEKYSFKAKMEGLRHLAAYLYDPDAPLPIRPVIKDGACLQSGCHNRDKLGIQEIQFTKKIRFKHEIHFSDEALNGHTITCDTCHFKVTQDNHFEVPEDICFLCHLKLKKPTLDKAVMSDDSISKITFGNKPSIDFNQGTSRCDICHTIPTRPLQNQLDDTDEGSTKEPITHQTIQESGVACEGCHFEVVKRSGEINTGNVASNGCLKCHNRSQVLLATAGDKGLMHDAHIPTRADCFDCHSVIEHKNRTDHLDFVRQDCQLCHVDQHKYQKLLLAGTPLSNEITGTPHLMYEVNTNCMACHLKKSSRNGHDVRTASGDTCAACHTEQHISMLKEWKKTLKEKVSSAQELAAEVRALLNERKEELSREKLNQLELWLTEGTELLDIVRVGNGVHNKKYAITILDGAFVKFEDSLDLLEDAGSNK